jgi:hypothetical protein
MTWIEDAARAAVVRKYPDSFRGTSEMVRNTTKLRVMSLAAANPKSQIRTCAGLRGRAVHAGSSPLSNPNAESVSSGAAAHKYTLHAHCGVA